MTIMDAFKAFDSNSNNSINVNEMAYCLMSLDPSIKRE